MLRDVKVTLQSRQTTTNDLGIFNFTDLTPGRFTIRFERTGYQTLTREIEIRDQFTNLQDFSLQPAQ